MSMGATQSLKNLIFVDCEAFGPCPSMGKLTEFGAVDYTTGDTFYGQLYERTDTPDQPDVLSYGEPINTGPEVFTAFAHWIKDHTDGFALFVSDNPAYDWQWINDGFWRHYGSNPFGHSARRIGDFYAGLTGNFKKANEWKRLRVTKHDHHPVNDAMGNVEAFEAMLKGKRA